MSHFVRCDRCSTQDATTGTLSLPPGWQKICHADLCEPCCRMIREFIFFKPSDAANLPTEPIDESLPSGPVDDKLFEIAPEAKLDVAAIGEAVAAQINAGALDKEGVTVTAQTYTSTAPDAEASPEERRRTRKAKKMQGQDAILPDKRGADFPRGANESEPGVH